MELQALASFSQQSWFLRSRTWFSRLIYPFLVRYCDDALLLIALLTAAPDARSLQVGAVLCLLASALIVWQQAYEAVPGQRAIVGPSRFVRYPRLLALWSVAIGLSLATRSFPALVLSTCLLPLLYRFGIQAADRALEKNHLEFSRYQQHVPALVPTLFPYPPSSHSAPVGFSWRRALLKPSGESKHVMLLLLFAWPLLCLQVFAWLPSWGLKAAAGIWFLLVVAWELTHTRPHKAAYSSIRQE